MYFDQTTLLVAASLLLAAFVKGTAGMGFPIIATPMVALLLDIRTAITVLIIPNLVMDFAQLFRGSFPKTIFLRFKWLLLLTVVGVLLGTTVLVVLPLWVLNLILGVMVLVFVLSDFFRFDFRVSPDLEGIFSPMVGLISGILIGITNGTGPVLAAYLYNLRLSKIEFIRSMATVFIIAKLSQLVAVSTWNLFTISTLTLSLGVTVFCLLGFYVGLKTQDRLNQQTFNRGLTLVLLAMGVTLIARSLS